MCKDDIRKNLACQLAADKLVDIVNAYEDARSAAAPISPRGQEGRHESRPHLRAMDKTGLTPDGEQAPSCPPIRNSSPGAFKAEVGEDNDPFAAKSGAYYAVKVDGVTPPKLKPLDQVRAAGAGRLDRRTAQPGCWRTRPRRWRRRPPKDKNLAAIAKDIEGAGAAQPGAGPQHQRHHLLGRAGGQAVRAPRRAAWSRRRKAPAAITSSPASPASPIRRSTRSDPAFAGRRGALSQQAAQRFLRRLGQCRARCARASRSTRSCCNRSPADQ